jgi:hypothetical protein
VPLARLALVGTPFTPVAQLYVGQIEDLLLAECDRPDVAVGLGEREIQVPIVSGEDRPSESTRSNVETQEQLRTVTVDRHRIEPVNAQNPEVDHNRRSAREGTQEGKMLQYPSDLRDHKPRAMRRSR